MQDESIIKHINFQGELVGVVFKGSKFVYEIDKFNNDKSFVWDCCELYFVKLFKS